MAKQSLLSNFVSLGLIQIANFVMPLISIPIISRIIGLENYGVIQYVFTIVAFLNLLIGYGFNYTATRRLSKDSTNNGLRSRVFSEVFYAQLVLFIISLIIFIVLYIWLPILREDSKVAWFSFFYCLSALFTQNWIFQAMQNMSKVTVINLLGKGVYLILVLSIVTSKELYYWQPLTLSISQILVSFISFYWAKKSFHLQLVRVSPTRILNLLKADVSIFITLILGSFYQSVNLIVLGLFVEKDLIGGFTAAQKLITVFIQLLALPLSQVLYPYLALSFSKDTTDGIRLAQKFVPIILILSFSFSLIILLFSKYIVLFFFGYQFESAIAILKIIAFVPLFNSLNRMIGIQFLVNLKLDSIYLKYAIISSVCSIFLNIVFTYYFSFIGSAITWVLTEILLFLFLINRMHKIKIKVFNLAFFEYQNIVNTLSMVRK